MLYDVMWLVLLGPQSVHAGPAEKHAAESSQSQGELQSQSQGDSQQSGAGGEWSSESDFAVESEMAEGLESMLNEHSGVGLF